MPARMAILINRNQLVRHPCPARDRAQPPLSKRSSFLMRRQFKHCWPNRHTTRELPRSLRPGETYLAAFSRSEENSDWLAIVQHDRPRPPAHYRTVRSDPMARLDGSRRRPARRRYSLGASVPRHPRSRPPSSRESRLTKPRVRNHAETHCDRTESQQVRRSMRPNEPYASAAPLRIGDETEPPRRPSQSTRGFGDSLRLLISRSHADLRWQQGRLHVERSGARSQSVFFKGEPQDALQPRRGRSLRHRRNDLPLGRRSGQRFRGGALTRGCGRLHRGRPQKRHNIEMPTNGWRYFPIFPTSFAVPANDEELFSRLTLLLMEGIPDSRRDGDRSGGEIGRGARAGRRDLPLGQPRCLDTRAFNRAAG